MKIGFLLDSCSRKAGGLFESVRRLAQQLSAGTSHTEIFCVEDEYSAEDAAQWLPLHLHLHERGFPASWGFAPGLRPSLLNADLDVLMTHGLWQYCSLVSLLWHKRSGRPHVIHPHGMLDPWALQHSRWKKRAASLLYENAHLRSAACIRALCESEALAIRSLGLKNPVCVIPNGVDLPDLGIQRPAPWGNRTEGRQVLLYLGRLHPKKNLVPLIKAWSSLQRRGGRARDWALVIAGWDQDHYEATLRSEVRELGLMDSVIFPGPLFDEAKSAAYQSASAFILPSLSEGLPMVVLEAWSHELPVLMSDACNLPEGFSSGAAWRVSTDEKGIAEGLEMLVSQSPPQLKSVGVEGRRLAASRFSWKQAGDEMSQVAQWVVKGGSQPSCLFE